MTADHPIPLSTLANNNHCQIQHEEKGKPYLSIYNMPCQYFCIGPPYGRVGKWKDVDAVSYLVSWAFGPSMSTSVETETLLVRTIPLP